MLMVLELVSWYLLSISGDVESVLAQQHENAHSPSWLKAHLTSIHRELQQTLSNLYGNNDHNNERKKNNNNNSSGAQST